MTTELQVLITAIVSIATILSGVYATRSAGKANKESTALTGYDSLVKTMQSEIATHNDDILQCQQRIREQARRISRLERREEGFVRWGRLVIRWYEGIRPTLELHPPVPPFPKPPPGIEDTDPDSLGEPI